MAGFDDDNADLDELALFNFKEPYRSELEKLRPSLDEGFKTFDLFNQDMEKLAKAYTNREIDIHAFAQRLQEIQKRLEPS